MHSKKMTSSSQLDWSSSTPLTSSSGWTPLGEMARCSSHSRCRPVDPTCAASQTLSWPGTSPSPTSPFQVSCGTAFPKRDGVLVDKKIYSERKWTAKEKVKTFKQLERLLFYLIESFFLWIKNVLLFFSFYPVWYMWFPQNWNFLEYFSLNLCHWLLSDR